MDAKERFYRQFQATTARLQEQISQLPTLSVAGGERQDAIEHVLAGISRLSSEVADASDYVPAYDQRTYSQTLKTLNDQFNDATAKLAPKNRFQFKPRTAAQVTAATDRRQDSRHLVPTANDGLAAETTTPSTTSTSDSLEPSDTLGSLPVFSGKNYNEEVARPTASGIRKPSFSAARDIVLSDHDRLHIILPSSAARATSAGALTNLRGCVVDMSVPTNVSEGAPFASLALKNIQGSVVVAGHVNGPAHITDVHNSILVVLARQVRIHECENVDLYLHSTSHPIIEDCKGMRFAPAPTYYISSRDEQEKNQWDQVDDFKWLKSDHSPNWSILPETERIPVDVWKSVPGAPGVGVEDILKKVGL
ncbi:tubulin binding cofactor C-domain-containing protein [Lasiosphaeria ovina]|uniref:Tubulin binding cofactor C-domain-containing protein n=1 Tax=Lasiosphaeria ovina TaxID=92902 RepID=A0AAE0KH95_9PEZI|nr:tubulin binding cofactor C-domain-containing protein [Lasiosphaeria ovina]